LQDVNKALEVVEREVKACVKEARLQEFMDDQALVTEALCAENCLGRWIWKSGEVQSAG
jgi:hypothetical protein